MLSDRLITLSSAPVWKHLGQELKFAENGKSEVYLKIKDEFLQHFGNVHGGILATLLDSSMASAVNSMLDDNVFTVTAEMNIQYIRPAMGSFLIGRGEVIKNGKTITSCKSEIFNERDELIAFATGTFVNKLKT
jgi:uncharacterized protein (TIGR00369 family)